jgi:hypothetical protein
MSCRFKFFLIAVLSCLTAVLFAQSDQEYKAIVGTPWKGAQGVRATTKQIMQWQAYTPYSFKFLVMPEERDEAVQPLPAPAGVKDLAQYPPAISGAYGGGLIPPKPAFSVSTSWDGAGFNDEVTGPAFVPPDTMGDVGPSNVVVVINNWIKVWDRNGNLGALNAHLDTFFNSVRNGFSVGDSRVKYDRLSQRWIITTFNTANSNNRICIAVSDGPNLTAGTVWTFYFFQHNLVSPAGDTNLFFDYPTLGVDSQALYIGGNCFNGNFTTTAFVVRKSSILSGGPIVVSAFRNLYTDGATGIYTPQGVDNDDPDSTDGYIIGHGAQYGTLRLRKITNPGTVPVMGPAQNVTGMLATNDPTSVPASGSATQLDGGDIRMLKAAIHTNVLTGEKTLWTAGTVGVNSSGTTTSPNRTGFRWYEVQNFSTTPSLKQAGTIFDNAAASPKFFWMGAAAMNRQGHAVIGMSMAGALNFASAAFTDRLSSDAAGTTRTPIVAAAGTAAYNLGGGNPQRWGDYSNTVVDPTDGMSIWTFQEYCNANNNYEVRVIKLLAPPPATPSGVSPNTAAQNSTVTFTVSGTSTNGSGFFDPGTGFANHLAATFSGSGVNVTAVRFTNPTSFQIDATIASVAATGTRNLTITNPDGQSVTLNNAITVESGAAALSSVSLPATIASGATVDGTVTLNKSAPSDTVVSLSSNNGVLSVPATVTVLAGQSTAQFSATAGNPVDPVNVTVAGTLDAVTKTVDTQVRGIELLDLAVNRTSVEGGSALNSRVTVTLSAAAPAGGKSVALSSDSGLITLPANLTVAAGSTTGSLTFKASKTGSPVVVTVSGTLSGVTKSDTITVQPPRPTGFLISPITFVGGSSTTVNATVTISQTAPAGGVSVAITTGSPNLTVPSSVTVAEGQTQAAFTIGHRSVPSQKIVNVNAQTGVSKITKAVTINPPTVSLIQFSAPQMVGGAGLTVTGTLTLDAPAPSVGVKVTLSKDSTAINLSPTTVTIASGLTQGTFNITAPAAVAADVTVTITATTSGVAKTKTFKVIAPKLGSVSVSPTSVVGGSATTVTFTVNLTGPAPTGGMVVDLASSNSALASVPATVTVPAGATTASVTVIHTHPVTQTAVTLSGSLNGITKNATLTVKP